MLKPTVITPCVENQRDCLGYKSFPGREILLELENAVTKQTSSLKMVQ